MSSLPSTFDDWVSDFSEWQHRVGFDPAWIGDFDLTIKFDWDRAGDTIEFGDFQGRKNGSVPCRSHTTSAHHLGTITVRDTEFASVEQRHLLATAPTKYDKYAALPDHG